MKPTVSTILRNTLDLFVFVFLGCFVGLFCVCHYTVEPPVNNPFTDEKDSDYFFNPVLGAVKDGITAGSGDGTFSPKDVCTRGQVVTFIHRALGNPATELTDNPFSDVRTKDYFYTPVLWAVENGITSGTSAGQFSPKEECTRGQVVTFLYRALAEK